ncbi:MAG: hypothetical protein RL365_7 [Bacteroidota bacterium]|jgi:hypothetical protein
MEGENFMIHNYRVCALQQSYRKYSENTLTNIVIDLIV